MYTALYVYRSFMYSTKKKFMYTALLCIPLFMYTTHLCIQLKKIMYTALLCIPLFMYTAHLCIQLKKQKLCIQLFMCSIPILYVYTSCMYSTSSFVYTTLLCIQRYSTTTQTCIRARVWQRHAHRHVYVHVHGRDMYTCMCTAVTCIRAGVQQ